MQSPKKFTDLAEVTRISEALARLGSAMDYVLILEPVRGWYYVLLTCTLLTKQDKRPRGTRTEGMWTVEEEFGPLHGSDVRQLVSESAEKLKLYKQGHNMPKPVLIYVITSTANNAFAPNHRSQVRVVRRNNAIEPWPIMQSKHIKHWPDLVGHGKFEPGRVRVEDLFDD